MAKNRRHDPVVLPLRYLVTNTWHLQQRGSWTAIRNGLATVKRQDWIFGTVNHQCRRDDVRLVDAVMIGSSL